MSERDWESHYRDRDMPWNHGGPAPGLVDFLASNPGLDRRPVLVPGCGLGNDAVAWAGAGFPTTGLDLAPTAVMLARGAAEGVTGLSFEVGNFLEVPPVQQPFGWIFEHTLYCAIDPSRRAAYAEALPQRLGPGGQFVAIHYLNPAAPEGPPFPCSREEILTRFGRHFELVADWQPRSWESRVGREWMFWWRLR